MCMYPHSLLFLVSLLWSDCINRFIDRFYYTVVAFFLVQSSIMYILYSKLTFNSRWKKKVLCQFVTIVIGRNMQAGEVSEIL